MAQQTFSGVPGDFTAGQVLTAADMDKLREFLLYLIKDGDEGDTGETSPLILDLGNDRVGINTDSPDQLLTVAGALGGYGIHIDSSTGAGIEIDRGASTNAHSVLFQTAGVDDWAITNYNNGDALCIKDGGYTGTEIARFMPSGLTFNGDTAAANALDTYEEGTWSPTYISTNGDMTSVVVNATFTKGTYVRIGKQVWIDCFIRTDSIGALGTGYAAISGLPFDAENVALYNAYPSPVHTFFSFGSDGPEYVYINNNSGEVWLGKHGSGAAVSTVIDATDLSTAANRNGIAFQLTYITDAAA